MLSSLSPRKCPHFGLSRFAHQDMRMCYQSLLWMRFPRDSEQQVELGQESRKKRKKKKKKKKKEEEVRDSEQQVELRQERRSRKKKGLWEVEIGERRWFELRERRWSEIEVPGHSRAVWEVDQP